MAGCACSCGSVPAPFGASWVCCARRCGCGGAGTAPCDQGGVRPCTYHACTYYEMSLLMQRLRRVQKLLEDQAGCLISVPADDPEHWQRRQSKPGFWSLAVLLGCASGCFGPNGVCREQGGEETMLRGPGMGFAAILPSWLSAVTSLSRAPVQVLVQMRVQEVGKLCCSRNPEIGGSCSDQAQAPRGAQGEDTAAPARLWAQEALCATGEWQQGCLVTFGRCPRSPLCSHQLPLAQAGVGTFGLQRRGASGCPGHALPTLAWSHWQAWGQRSDLPLTRFLGTALFNHLINSQELGCQYGEHTCLQKIPFSPAVLQLKAPLSP